MIVWFVEFVCWEQMIFRIYTETQWYPGRQINYINLLKMAARSEGNDAPVQANTSGKGRSIMASSEEDSKGDVVEPPKFITSRNIVAALERLGYDSSYAHQIFTTLCDRVARSKKFQNSLNASCALPAELSEDSGSSAGQHNDPRDSFFDSNNSNNSGSLPPSSQGPPDNQEGSGALASSFEDSNSYLEDFEEGEERDQFNPEHNINNNNNSALQLRMDVQEFIQACRMDDVLIQAIFRKPRQYISRIVRKATKQAQECNGLHPVSYFVEEEFLMTLNESNQSNNTSGRKSIASAVGKSLIRSFHTFLHSSNSFFFVNVNNRYNIVCSIWFRI